ncbi:MAG: hypothetical protein QOE70_6570 [Chthoniobacter sp.]|nr:hypothetical protein [Chthoniobacter sp.]
MRRSLLPSFTQIELLEARIAPALVLANPLPDVVAGSGKTSAKVDLSKMFDPAAQHANHTLVEFVTNVDVDPSPTVFQAGKIVIELLDDVAPLTVQAFLGYVTSLNLAGDYDGTIIHRTADFGAGSGPGNDIIQGGGFEFTAGSHAHIKVGPNVHNEYSDAHPNTRGTIALAKTGQGPNTGTSEWFINVNDNSTILGPTNGNSGGYTVFGQVLSGMDLVDRIAGLATHDFGNPLTAVPLQSPLTGANPTPSQLVRVVDARVQPSVVPANPNITFQATSSSDLLIPTVVGQTLNLKFAPGKSGFADVMVTATPKDGSPAVTDTFRVDVRPNLIVNFDGDSLPGAIVPGDTATLKFHLTNNGAAAAQGTADIDVFLAKVGDALSVIPLASFSGVTLNLAGGRTQSFIPAVQIPTELATTEGEVYQLMAKVTPLSGSAAAERFTDDDVAVDGGQHQLFNRFGTFGGRTNVVLKDLATDALGHQTLVTWSMKGPGAGVLSSDAQGLHLVTDGTTALSTLSATVGIGAAHVPLESIQLLSTIGAASLGAIDLDGYFVASNGVKTLTLGDLTGQALMLIGALPPDNLTKATINLGRVRDFSLESLMPVAALTATEWRDTAGTANDTISAPALDALRIKGGLADATHSASRGDFEADVTLSDPGLPTSVTIAGLLRNATIQSFGNVGTVTLGGMEHSNLFLGVTARPDNVSDFTDDFTLTSFNILGIKGFTGSLFSDSQVAAQTLGTIKVKDVATDSGTGDFGFIADVIKSYTRIGGPTALNVKEPTVIEDPGHYLVQVL